MTKREFEDITEWYELKDLCYDENCYICEDVYYGDTVNEIINESLVDRARNCTWEELRGELNNYPSISEDEYYFEDDYYGWREADCDDFEDYKNMVREWMDERNRWDEDDDEEDGDEEEDDVEECSVSIDDVICIHVDLSSTEMNMNNLWR